MYKLFLDKNTYAMGTHALLEEIGAPFELIPTEIFTANPDPAFLSVSPHARVPALLYDAGGEQKGLCESGAIALFLADRHPESALAPPPGDPRRSQFLQWMFYLSSTLQPDVLLQFHPEALFSDSSRQEEVKSASMDRLMKVWSVLEQTITGPYLFGTAPTAFDFCLGLQAIWPECFARTIDDFPKIAGMVESLSQRPAVRQALAWHGY